MLGVGQVDVDEGRPRAPQRIECLVKCTAHTLVNALGDERARDADSQPFDVTRQHRREIGHRLPR